MKRGVGLENESLTSRFPAALFLNGSAAVKKSAQSTIRDERGLKV